MVIPFKEEQRSQAAQKIRNRVCSVLTLLVSAIDGKTINSLTMLQTLTSGQLRFSGSSLIEWTEDGCPRQARWHSERGAPAPRQVRVVDDRMPADEAWGAACQGVALLWRGDFHNARQLLTALARRADRPARKPGKPPASLTEAFHIERQARSQRARTLGLLLIEIDANYVIQLPRAPDVRAACLDALGAAQDGPMLMSLRELQGLIGAHQWRLKGIEIPALGARIHPHYGVFAPTRGEYLDLVAKAPLPAALKSADVADVADVAFDIGTGTGVLSALLLRRGVARVVATDQDARALACARDNLARLGLLECVELQQADLFPDGRAGLIVCNPPWVPARPASPLEHAVYDPESRMLLGFLRGLSQHLAPGGEGWLILSDLAEHLGLRSRDELLLAIEAAGLVVAGRIDIRPQHPKAADPADALAAARRAEVTSLWRLRVSG